MKIGLIGKGKMGRLIESLAVEHGHEVAASIDAAFAARGADELSAMLKGIDVVIDFSGAEAVKRNVEACMLAGVPLVEGTTGWNEQRTEIESIVSEHGGAMVFGSNFSIGVNLFYRVVDFAAELLARFPEYEAFIEEQHHSRKKDAPSGTALKLNEIVSRHVQREYPVVATRAGNIPGTHRVGFDGIADQILLEHTARSRDGFALGAILAAQWVLGKTGFYEFGEVMEEVIGK
ncbi:MAG TPA: dihydrodipicolinate reductase C-terminal domain-containing protein [Pyrinomonadaceae bacterium]|nr:dihydrodipicolinate reductase C-terminal domain-containing protein [Pyrinomonadaceae bacterium]